MLDLKEHLRAAGMNGNQLARKIDRPKQQVYRWLKTGRISRVWEENLRDYFKTKEKSRKAKSELELTSESG